MSLNGKFTPLGINVYSGFLQNIGIDRNQKGQALQGTWTPSSYTQGTVTNTTVLDKLTQAIPLAYAAYQASTISGATFQALVTMGSSSIPALANSRPSTFVRTYAGASDPYPPLDYPNPLSTYAWITGWDYTGASPVYASTSSYTGIGNDYWKYGFLGCVARQAYYEVFTDSPTKYLSFVRAWNRHTGWQQASNQTIASLANSKTFLLNNYSNINDLTTSDMSGVNMSLKSFGTEIIKLGRLFQLNDLDKFGLPSRLLKTLQQYNAVTEALKLSLLLSGLELRELNNILTAASTPSTDQEQKIYSAFSLVTGNDLINILIIMNCATGGLRSLADVLDPKYMFPVSYISLTVPKYSIQTISNKTYNLIYKNGGVDTSLQNWGTYLRGILADDIAQACGAFSMSIRQVKNINNMNAELFGQVVSNLELTSLDLPLINSDQAFPGNQAYSSAALAKLAFGSGPSGTFRTCDFFGAASGDPYNKYYELIVPLINQLTTPALSNYYTSILANYNNQTTLNTLITQVNTELVNIYNSNTAAAKQLNYYWEQIGKQLTCEQIAIPFSVSDPAEYSTALNRSDIDGFVKTVYTIAQQTQVGGAADTLEGICDLTNLAGQSLKALMRESRNSARLSIMGGSLDSDIPDSIGGNYGPVSGSTNDPQPIFGPSPATGTVNYSNGEVLAVNLSFNGTAYDPCQPPKIMLMPIPGASIGVELTPIIDANTGSITAIEINNPKALVGFNNDNPPQLYVEPPPNVLINGGPVKAGSQSGEPGAAPVQPDWEGHGNDEGSRSVNTGQTADWGVAGTPSSVEAGRPTSSGDLVGIMDGVVPGGLASPDTASPSPDAAVGGFGGDPTGSEGSDGNQFA